MRFRAFIAVSSALLVISSLAGAALAARPSLDVMAGTAARPDLVAELRKAAERPELRAVGVPGQVDERLGVPTIVWGTRAGAPAVASGPGAGRASAAAAARDHLAGLAPYYRLDAADARGAVMRYVHDTGRGGIIVAFRQEVGGIEVFRDEVKILMDRNLDLVAASGYIPSRALAGRGAPAFRLPVARALDRALGDFSDGALGAGAVTPAGSAPGGYENYRMTTALPGGASDTPIRTKKVLFHRADRLEPAYYVEVVGETEAYAYVVSADDGGILFRNSLMANDAYTYRVWADAVAPYVPSDSPQGNTPTPHPTGLPDYTNPPYVAPGLVTLQNGPISTNDPWLPPGATVTTGNNVDAFADLAAPDGYGAGDVRPTTTSPGAFDRVYDTSLAPGASTNQRMAAVTQLFFVNNWLHDWFYDAGFDEASGNAQADNYGRGGVAGDRMRAEGQDYGGTNNANMLTPADGGAPRMQMYVFNAPGLNKITVNSPPAIAGDLITGIAGFGPQTFNVIGDVVLVNDVTGVTSDACEPIANVLIGKIALIDRGSCTFASKVEKAQAGNAIGVIIVNNQSGAPPNMGGTPSVPITIPVLSISDVDGAAIKAQLGGGVNVTMQRGPEVARDGTIDNMIIAHEWGHYISNRLVGNGGGLNTTQSAGMGEGWGDFHALLMTVRPEDAAVPSNPDYSGVFAAGSYAVGSVNASNATYFGIRRVPYSTDFTKNALTFKHIANGQPLPAGVPTAFGLDGANNAEVHNTGEVWCAMLWECYAALLADTGRLTFEQARQRMTDYLVAGYKLTPVSPTFVEARDAILAAALAYDAADYAAFWAAFARRGIGMGAVAPDRYTTTNAPVIESYAVGGDLQFVSATLTDDVHSCDNDGVLDNGEIGTLTVTLMNTGATPLNTTTATVTSTNGALSFLNGNQMVFPSSPPGAAVTRSLQVLLQGAVGVEHLDLQIDYDDDDLFIAGPRVQNDGASGNADEASATIETVETSSIPWTMTALPGSSGEWSVGTSGGGNHVFFAPDPPSISDLYLTTPPLQVAGAGDFTFTFRHAHAFEADIAQWDGGVIELSNNGGATWVDIGGSATPGYTGVIYGSAGNPLAARTAYTGISAGYPTLNLVTVNLGATYAGQTVLVRFRLGSDEAVGSNGWMVDDIQFNNITNTPFTAFVGDPDVCSLVAVDPTVPRDFGFAIAGPNPAGQRADFRFALPVSARVAISIYDVSGRRVASVAEGEYAAGTHTASWSGARKAGVYFARMTADGREFTRRIVMLR